VAVVNTCSFYITNSNSPTTCYVCNFAAWSEFKYAGFEVHTAVAMTSSLFSGIWCLIVKSSKSSKERKKPAWSTAPLLTCFMPVFAWLMKATRSSKMDYIALYPRRQTSSKFKCTYHLWSITGYNGYSLDCFNCLHISSRQRQLGLITFYIPYFQGCIMSKVHRFRWYIIIRLKIFWHYCCTENIQFAKRINRQQQKIYLCYYWWQVNFMAPWAVSHTITSTEDDQFSHFFKNWC
jgi:hypothetical protein